MAANQDENTGGTRLFFKNNSWAQCLRRVARANIAPDLAPVWIHFPDLSNLRFVVTMIGELGAYCRSGPVPLAVQPDHMVDIVLIIEDERYECEGRVRYLQKSAGGLAVEFVQPEERIRRKIRTLFGPELLASTLAPLVSYTSVDPGSNSTLIYSDGDANALQVALLNERIAALFIDLEIMGVHIHWHRTPPMASASAGFLIVPDAQKKIMNFVRNLPGLSPEFLADIEAILVKGRFHQHSVAHEHIG